MSIDFMESQFASGEYGFKKIGPGDFATVRRWLDSPHLADWWTPDENVLTAIQNDDAGYAAYIADHQGLPFAYIQAVEPGFDPVLVDQGDFPSGTIRLDQFVGDPQMIGFGHGIKVLKAFVAAMRTAPGVQKLLAVPAKDNVFAQRSFSQSGFRPEKTLDTLRGAYVLMGQKVA